MDDHDEDAPEAFLQALADMGKLMEPIMERMEIRRTAARKQRLEDKSNFIEEHAFLCWKSKVLYEGEPLRCYLVESPLHAERERMKVDLPEVYARVYGISRSLARMGRFNGYVQFPKLPVVAPGYKGILDYVQVHGGITYFQDWWDGSVTYGFDTAHTQSMEMFEIVNDLDWMMQETEAMARGIMIAARFEPYYLRANDDNQKKARVLDRMSHFTQIDPSSNVAVMINLLSGHL